MIFSADTSVTIAILSAVVGPSLVALIAMISGVLTSRAAKAAKDTQTAAKEVRKDAASVKTDSESISAERELIQTLKDGYADIRAQLIRVESREQRCQERLTFLEERDEEHIAALRDASVLQKALQHEVEDLKEQVDGLNGIIERRKTHRE